MINEYKFSSIRINITSHLPQRGGFNSFLTKQCWIKVYSYCIQ